MKRCFFVLTIVLAWLVLGCKSDRKSSQAAGAGGRNTVVWISVDGFRGDYIDRTNLPTISRLRAEGLWTRHMRPVFPSLTFPVHVSEATGVDVQTHGVTGNQFYDAADGLLYDYTSDSTRILAEPIWVTAKKAGLRVAVYDWPLSQIQRGNWESDVHAIKFDSKMTDEQRADRIIAVMRDDPATPAPPFQLVMGYIEVLDKAGHKYGPDSPEMIPALATMDTQIGRIMDGAIAAFDAHKGPNDRLFFVLSTDHGMTPVHTLVNGKTLLAGLIPKGATFVYSGNIGHIFIPAPQDSGNMMAELEQQLSRYDFMKVYRRGNLPAAWGYDQFSRVGDLVLVCNPGWTFNGKPEGPFTVLSGDQTPKGMHGYDVATDPEMFGFSAVWEYGRSLGGKELKEIDALQFYPTVTRMLEIKPAPEAKGAPIEIR